MAKTENPYYANEKKITGYANQNKTGVKYGQPDASLTVEAAMALPLFLFLMAVFLFWIQFYRTQEESMGRLNKNLRAAAQYAYAATMLETGWMGGGDGEQQWENTRITMVDASVLHIPLPIAGGDHFFVRKAYARPFTGRRYAGRETGEKEEDPLVYVAETGTVYHTNQGCTHLRLSIESVALDSVQERRNQDGAIYYPCERCTGDGAVDGGQGGERQETGLVYITREGNRYHYSLGCSGLTRRIRSMRKTEAESQGRRLCSRCTGKNGK